MIKPACKMLSYSVLFLVLLCSGVLSFADEPAFQWDGGKLVLVNAKLEVLSEQWQKGHLLLRTGVMRDAEQLGVISPACLFEFRGMVKAVNAETAQQRQTLETVEERRLVDASAWRRKEDWIEKNLTTDQLKLIDRLRLKKSVHTWGLFVFMDIKGGKLLGLSESRALKLSKEVKSVAEESDSLLRKDLESTSNSLIQNEFPVSSQLFVEFGKLSEVLVPARSGGPYFFDRSTNELRIQSEDASTRRLYSQIDFEPRLLRYAELAFAGNDLVDESISNSILKIAESIRMELSSGDDDPAIHQVIQDELRKYLIEHQSASKFRNLEQFRLAQGFSSYGYMLFIDEEAVEMLNLSKESKKKLQSTAGKIQVEYRKLVKERVEKDLESLNSVFDNDEKEMLAELLGN